MLICFVTYNVGKNSSASQYHKHSENESHNTSCDIVSICLQECHADPAEPHGSILTHWLNMNCNENKYIFLNQYKTPYNFVQALLPAKIVTMLAFKHKTYTHDVEFTLSKTLNLGYFMYNSQFSMFTRLRVSGIQIDIIGVHFHDGFDYEKNTSMNDYRCIDCYHSARKRDWLCVRDEYERVGNKDNFCVLLGDMNFCIGSKNVGRLLQHPQIENEIDMFVKTEELTEDLQTMSFSRGFQEVEKSSFCQATNCVHVQRRKH